MRDRRGRVVGTQVRGIPRPGVARRTLALAGGLGVALERVGDGPAVELAGGATVGGRLLPLRGSEDGWVAVAPGAAITAVVAGERRVALRLPEPAAQCGYTARFSL